MDANRTFSMPATENSNGRSIGALTLALRKNMFIPAFKFSPIKRETVLDKPQLILSHLLIVAYQATINFLISHLFLHQ